MRVCVLFASKAQSTKVRDIATGLADGIATQGHTVDVFDMRLEAGKVISYYDYLVIGTESDSFWGGKIPSVVKTFLKQAGTISGKRCMAFIAKGGFRTMKSLLVLMRVMEKEGMYLKTSDILATKDHAKEVGKRLHIS